MLIKQLCGSYKSKIVTRLVLHFLKLLLHHSFIIRLGPLCGGAVVDRAQTRSMDTYGFRV